MITVIKAKLKKSSDQTNIDKYRVAANIKEYHTFKISMFWKYKLFGHYYRVDTLSTFYLTVSGIIIPNF